MGAVRYQSYVLAYVCTSSVILAVEYETNCYQKFVYLKKIPRQVSPIISGNDRHNYIYSYHAK